MDAQKSSEDDSTRTIRRLACAVFLIALLFWMWGGSSYFVNAEKFASFFWAVITFFIGAFFFVLGWLLVTKQSFFSAVLLTVTFGLLTVFMSYAWIKHILAFGLEAITTVQPWFLVETILSTSIGCLLVWASIRGAKAAKRLKENHNSNISPDVFS